MIARGDLVQRGLILLLDLGLVLLPTLVAIGLRVQVIPFGRDLNGRPHFTNDNLRRLDEITSGFSRAHTVGDTMIALNGTSLAICVAVFLVVAFFVYHFTPTVASGATPAELIINRFNPVVEELSASYLEAVASADSSLPSDSDDDTPSSNRSAKPPKELALVALPELELGQTDPIEITLSSSDPITAATFLVADENQDEPMDQRLQGRPLSAADQATSSEIILSRLPGDNVPVSNKPPLPLPRALRQPSPRYWDR